MQRTLLVEDHHDTAIWLQDRVTFAFPSNEVIWVDSLSCAREALINRNFDLVLLDINLPDGSGLELIPEIRELQSPSYIIVTTIFDDEKSVFSAMQLGANGYLLKDYDNALFVEKLKGILRGDPPLSPAIARKLLDYFHNKAPRQNKDSPLKSEYGLTKREEEVITLVAKGISNKEIARLLDISVNTASGYVKNCYQKLNISSRAEASLKAVELGLVVGG